MANTKEMKTTIANIAEGYFNSITARTINRPATTLDQVSAIVSVALIEALETAYLEGRISALKEDNERMAHVNARLKELL